MRAKLLALLGWASLTAGTVSGSSLLPGSIDFTAYLLWDKEVRFGFDDSGNYTGATHWYLGIDDGVGKIVQHVGQAKGYLKTSADSEVHRTISPLTALESSGPAAIHGQAVPEVGIYIDSTVTLYAHDNLVMPRRFSERDKINCWIYVSPDKTVTNFVVTAGLVSDGGVISATNYVTDASVIPGKPFRLTLRARANAVPGVPGLIGFEVRVDDRLVAADEVTLFPSMVEPTSEYAERLYSFGVSGAAAVENINFTGVNPQENPGYDQDDVTMLRESAEIVVEGFPKGVNSLIGFPLLVRVSEANIAGFYYSRADYVGNDIRFTDENGKLLPFEIDTWNPGGESLFWVKVPLMRNGARIRMHWGQQSGSALPPNNPREVWSDYVAVWHFSDAAAGSAKDSTGNGWTARVENGNLVVAAEPMVGPAGYLAQQAEGSASLMAADLSRQLVDGEFTLTGWYLARDLTAFGDVPFVGYKAGQASSALAGWGVATKGLGSIHYLAQGAAGYTLSGLPDITKNWFHVGFSHTPDDAFAFYANGRLVNGGVYAYAPTNCGFQVFLNGFCGDEIRIAKTVRSEIWIQAEYNQELDAGYLKYGNGSTKDSDNYWVEEPQVIPNAVSLDEVDSLVVYAGRPRYGVSILKYYDLDGRELKARPTVPGTYRVVADVPAGVRSGLTYELYFVIFEQRAYRQLSGYDRVMLFNSDESPECPVALQGFYDVDSTTNEVWEHSGSAWDGSGRFVMDGDMHVYNEPDTGRPLWHFRHARIGNLFQNDWTLKEGMNMLPWGGNACRFEDSEKRANGQRYAGTLILQNRSLETDAEDPAAAYSPYYPNGVGTVYFDAVNAYCDYAGELKVQLCESDEAVVTEGEWKDVLFDVFAICDGVTELDSSVFGTNVARLAMRELEGTTNWFYRVRAAIDHTGPARIRIVRVDAPGVGFAADVGPDGEGLVIVDNIIVSAPAMGARLRQYGAPAYGEDDTRDIPTERFADAFCGQRAPFDIAFPTAADIGRLHGLAKVEYIVNGTNEVDASFVGAMTMNYRWRYLNQKVNPWKRLLMNPSESDPTKFVTTAPLEADGTGDIEYSVEATVNAPFYEYWDYSGLSGWRWPDGYTERRDNVRISAVADGVYSEAKPSPAMGTDYFVRLRDGASAYEAFRLYVRRPERPAEVSMIPMKLADDHIWRGFYQTLTNFTAGLEYRIVALNPQVNGGSDYQWSTNYLHGVDQRELPVNDVLVDGGADEWAKVPCDGVTGYLLFQVEDQTRTLTVIHADYQNFNRWTDANLPDGDVNGHFVGTFTDVDRRSGASRKAQNWAETFTMFAETAATNGSWWTEFFNVVAETEGDWAIEKPFSGKKLTPNGWTAMNGMWVSERYREINWPSIAFQMKGEGYGSIQFPAKQTPRGVETFTFSSRIAQSYNIHSFNYYTGTTNDVYAMKNYTFAVNCGMATLDDKEFTGVGSVSVVANFRDSKGGYEARLERVSEDQVQLCLYKWLANGTVQALGRSSYYQYGGSSGMGLDGYQNHLGALFISCSNAVDGVRVVAGVLNTPGGVKVDKSTRLSGSPFYKVCFCDSNTVNYVSGTFGVGSRDCPAVFARPVLSPNAVAWATDWASAAAGNDPGFHHWTSSKTVTFANEQPLINFDEDYENWNIYRDRMDIKDYSNDVPAQVYGFKAQVPNQYVVVETSPHLEENFTPVCTNYVRSFGFEEQVIKLYLAEDVDVLLHTGLESGSSDVVIDSLSLRQWRGEDYDDASNPDRYLFPDVGYGAPSNFIYTTAWINDRSEVELNPMRATAETPASVRSPLMDGRNGRGTGLGSFSFAYRDAHPKARLLVQIATNDVDYTTLASITESQLGWETVETVDFSALSADDRKQGIISTYIGQHGIVGVMRAVVDPELARQAHNPLYNENNDPEFGRVFITMAGARDNPTLDSGSWWGWNLRTTDDESMWLLSDGTKGDLRTHGLSYALNNSVTDDVRADQDYKPHMPFLQTPIFLKGVVGEVSFKARKYNPGDANPTVTIYGTTSTDPAAEDSDFEYLGEIEIGCDRYETFSFQAPLTKNYTAFRFAVTGVAGVTGEAGPYPAAGNVQRVLLDEVAVFEAIRARLGFRNTGTFRTNLGDARYLPNMPRKDQQPLCNEEWGIQTELYAAQLSNKIDLDTPEHAPRVFFHWYENVYPWGYDNWRDHADAKSAELARAEGTDSLVYRSSHLSAAGSVVAPSEKSGTVVQYSLEVVYYMKGQDLPLTNALSAADWQKPAWFEPVDCNAQYGNGAFSAYNILDTVAPGWAWINEVNLFGGYAQSGASVDKDYQYLEIAVPSEADITGWSVRMLVAQTGSGSVLTNEAATFGQDGLTGMKKDLLGQASGMVFRVIASLPTYQTGRLSLNDGTLDGVWNFKNWDGNILKADGRISEMSPFGIQLVRSSGIVEDEIVVIGTNFWAGSEYLRDQYSPTNTVNFLNAHMSGADFVYVGDDDGGETKSLSVATGRGESSNNWDRVMVHTPGRINTYADGTPQEIDPDHPSPFGTSIYVYCNLLGPHIYQTCGEAVDSTASQILVIQKNSQRGTNVTYRVDKWYELGSVRANDVEVASVVTNELDNSYMVTIGLNAESNVTVVAEARVCKELRDLGVDEQNRYSEAIIDWFSKGRNLYGVEWPEGPVRLAKFVPYRRGIDYATDMSLTDMYWLDMCPTLPHDQYLIAGFALPPTPVERPLPDRPEYAGYEGDASLTNRQMSIYMAISNGIGRVTDAGVTNTMYSPYVIRGLTPGYTSWDYATNSLGFNWTNASFKVNGILANGLTQESNKDNWVSLRWFVFDENSFYGPNAGEQAFTTEIEIKDPFATDSPGYAAGWAEWAKKHGWRPAVFNGWAIDERQLLMTIEVLRPRNYYEDFW